MGGKYKSEKVRRCNGMKMDERDEEGDLRTLREERRQEVSERDGRLFF
jgi:hypothetical protein